MSASVGQAPQEFALFELPDQVTRSAQVRRGFGVLMPDLYPVDDPDDADPRLAPLLAWRQQLVDSGAVAARSFKEAHLRLVLRSGRTDVEQIREMLPGSVAEHAEDMARVLADLQTQVPDKQQQQPSAAGDVHPIAFRHGESRPGVVELSWPDYQANGGVVLYRVVSAEDRAPRSSENADLVAATPLSAASDDRPLTGPVRYYQVWVITGTSRADALSTRPVLYASGVLVAPPADVSIREDSGLVIGKWTSPPATKAVHVYRIPLEDAEGPAIDESRYRILADGEHRTGFVDSGAARGMRYRYRVRSAVDVDGAVQLSEPVDADVEVSAVLAAVTDISVDTAFDGESFDVSWAAPGAEVAIYLSQTGPSAGSVSTELPENALEQVGLAPDLRLRQPVANQAQPDGSTRTLMTGVPWPQGWSRAYVTPVTILAGRAVLGRTVSAVHTGTIRDVELVEYCNKQVLTFEWPRRSRSGGDSRAQGARSPGRPDRQILRDLTGGLREVRRHAPDRCASGGRVFTAPGAGCVLRRPTGDGTGCQHRVRRHVEVAVCGPDRPRPRWLPHHGYRRGAVGVRTAGLAGLRPGQQSAADAAECARR
ncbi:hypothetical protein [Mycolicibacterium peregrinum]|uniref:hypothetical protein n=1 Tax=Mycolicibacterium peregrinum TaxID=43304 RepID=UPI003AAEEB7E